VAVEGRLLPPVIFFISLVILQSSNTTKSKGILQNPNTTKLIIDDWGKTRKEERGSCNLQNNFLF
jgi:hypothetical protein